MIKLLIWNGAKIMRSSKSKISLRIKFCIIIFVVSALLCAMTIGVAYFIHAHSVEIRYNKLSKSVSQTVSGFVTSQDVEKYLEGENTLGYISVNNKIRHLKSTVPNIQSIGVYKINAEGMQIVFDTSSSDVKGGFGKLEKYDNTWRKYKDELLKRKTIESAQVLSNQGIALMYCQPMEGYANGDLIYICTGISKNIIDAEKNSFVSFNGKVLIFVTLILLIAALLLFEKKIIKPVKSISLMVEDASEKTDSEFIHSIIGADLKTGNELENIYRALLRIYTSKARLYAAVSKADDSSVQSIMHLIKRMDNFTATHLDNSVQYVILIVEELRKREKYKELISDKAVEELLLAAPLHDIGKLAIPKEIVGKPGRLTDEEYEIMKKHAEYGGKIIDELYLKDSSESYLYLAKEIAVHHHERWDGSGYPHKLKGEEIPLAVRIVSIADVFDALVSERVYKKAYSFEKSFDIILEESGEFFDPEIVAAFVSIKDKIRAVYKRISKQNH